jgi:glyoxylase-like metal-dependent hydrolase (beta-lactamase superfamily II)
MDEILPGVWHWSTEHEGLGVPVSSYYVEPAGAVIDPRVPGEGLEAAFEDLARPQQVILTTGLHARHAAEFAEAFDCAIRASDAAVERRAGDPEMTPYSEGEEVAPGITTIHIGAIAQDEFALHVDVAEGAIAIGDALNHYGDELAFFSDGLLGDDPEAVKAGLTEAMRALLERDFDHLLFGHGDPIVGGAKAALREFVKRRDAGSLIHS